MLSPDSNEQETVESPRSDGPNVQHLRLGIYAPAKKFNQFFAAFIRYCEEGPLRINTRDGGVHLVQVDCFDLGYEEVGRDSGSTPMAMRQWEELRLDVVMHKVSDDLALLTGGSCESPQQGSVCCCNSGETMGVACGAGAGPSPMCTARQRVGLLKEFCDRNRNIALFEGLDGCELLCSRQRTLRALCEVLEGQRGAQNPALQYEWSVPPTDLITLSEGSITGVTAVAGVPPIIAGEEELPGVGNSLDVVCIAKTEVACGSKPTHRMAVGKLGELLRYYEHQPPRGVEMIVQQYLAPRGNTITKVYAAGEQCVVLKGMRASQLHTMATGRASPTSMNELSGSTEGEGVKLFDSHDSAIFSKVSLPECQDDMSSARATDQGKCTAAAREVSERTLVLGDIQEILRRLSKRLGGIHLLGLDIICSAEGRYYVIDVNFFPSYSGVPMDVVGTEVVQLIYSQIQMGTSPR